MINFIKESLKTNELYLDTNTLNKIIENFKKGIIKNKDIFLKVYSIDIKNCMQTANLNVILDLLESYKNQKISTKKEKKTIIASYCGNPYITINLCIQSLLQKTLILAITEDSMFAINSLLIKIFNNILNKYNISKTIEIFNLVQQEEIKKIEKYASNIICIGNTNTYYKYKKNGIDKLNYIPFKNMAIYCDNTEYLGLQTELYKYAIANGIEVEIYQNNIEEFIECVNLDSTLENIVAFSKSENVLTQIKDKIKNGRLYLNRNPFKDENFSINLANCINA